MKRVDESEITDVVTAVFEQLWAERVELPNGDYGWLSVERDDQTGELILVAHDGVYSGQLGIAVFAAALYRVLGEERYADVATDIAQVYLPMERDDRRPIGCSNGLASMAYGFAKIGQLLDDDQYIDHAKGLTHWIVERIDDDEPPVDLLHGTAGVLLVILSVYELTRSKPVLERAQRVGEALVADATDSHPEHGWNLDHETGMAHGHAGIAYALYRLAALSGDETYRRAADHAVRHENEYYSPAENSWCSSASDPRPRYAWCNGDAGIGAARAASLRFVESDTLRRDVTRVNDGLTYALPPNDSLCHGSFSLAVFLHACTASGEYDMNRQGADLAHRVIERSQQTGYFQLVYRAQTDLLPTSLFSGVSGIGYMLLRSLAPETVPSVALID